MGANEEGKSGVGGCVCVRGRPREVVQLRKLIGPQEARLRVWQQPDLPGDCLRVTWDVMRKRIMQMPPLLDRCLYLRSLVEGSSCTHLHNDIPPPPYDPVYFKSHQTPPRAQPTRLMFIQVDEL